MSRLQQNLIHGVILIGLITFFWWVVPSTSYQVHAIYLPHNQQSYSSINSADVTMEIANDGQQFSTWVNQENQTPQATIQAVRYLANPDQAKLRCQQAQGKIQQLAGEHGLQKVIAICQVQTGQGPLNEINVSAFGYHH